MIPSLVSVATVISYYGYKDETRRLMDQLSQITRAHFYSQRLKLNNFVRVRPAVEKMPFFGRDKPYQPERCEYFEWPKNMDYEKIKREMRCAKFSIRQANNEAL